MKRNDYLVSRSDYKLYPFDGLTQANVIRRMYHLFALGQARAPLPKGR